ncbi:hypothetical protein RJT34_11527 [Clitoria ternatea]|uniref:Uncharacterized protein n=1 Tax=Clitoria ternatea TaxID=43366 RepID=A0AAN9PK54_CLITE
MHITEVLFVNSLKNYRNKFLCHLSYYLLSPFIYYESWLGVNIPLLPHYIPEVYIFSFLQDYVWILNCE